MSGNGSNICEDAEMADCDGEKVVTMMDVLKEQEDFEDDANAVLGASDDKNCTYSKGYIKRQAIYACMTCCTDAKTDATKWAGVCLACSLTCHENHELIELYTKRNFRCDCGNPKFNSHPCQFTPNKTDINTENNYNQNFGGVYCICHRPYPDPESNTQGDMIQCIICEDWLHSEHLDAVVPANEQYSEMICKTCMDKNEFLHDYGDLIVNRENIDIDISNISSEANSIVICNGDSNIKVTENENITNSNFDNTVHAQIDNMTIANKAIDEDGNKIDEQSCTNLEPTKDSNESSNEPSEIDIAPKESPQTNVTEENICELEPIKTIDTEPKNELLPEETKSLMETTKQNSLPEGEAKPTGKTEKSDDRSQEQVEEDLLLAEPVDTDLDDKPEPNKADQSSRDGLINEKQFESEAMDISESVNEDQIEKTDKYFHDKDNDSESDNKPITKQSVNETSPEETTDMAIAEASGSVIIDEGLQSNVTTLETKGVAISEDAEYASTEQLQNNTPSEDKQAENTAKIQNSHESEGNTDESKTLLRCEDSTSATTNKELENVSEFEQPDNVECDINEDLIQSDKIDKDEQNALLNEDNAVRSEDNSTEKNNSTLIELDNNTSKETVDINIEKDDTEIKSIGDNEVQVKSADPEILKRKFSCDEHAETATEVKKPKLDDPKCVRPKQVKKVFHGATFWPSNFRHKLCTCNECISMYKDLSVLFLIDPEDTVTAYERLGKEKTDGEPASQYEKGMAALSSLGRVQQINALTEYGKLRDKLLDFLKTFKDKKVIVKEEDIKAFFAGMKAVREPDGVYFCR